MSSKSNDIQLPGDNSLTDSATSSARAEGAGKAYQSVAQSTAIAVQDAADNLRNVNSISTTALGVLLSQFIETGDQKYADAINIAQNMQINAANAFKLVGINSADVLKDFPSGQ